MDYETLAGMIEELDRNLAGLVICVDTGDIMASTEFEGGKRSLDDAVGQLHQQIIDIKNFFIENYVPEDVRNEMEDSMFWTADKLSPVGREMMGIKPSKK